LNFSKHGTGLFRSKKFVGKKGGRRLLLRHSGPNDPTLSKKNDKQAARATIPLKFAAPTQ
jgi:hypothetical protein